MANDPLPPRIAAEPVSVEDIQIQLFDPGPNNPQGIQSGATYEVQLAMSDGSVQLMRGNLVPHLTSAEVEGLQSLVARLRGKAETAWIP